MSWYHYVVECADGTLYAGATNDLAGRLDAHDSGRGARYTSGRGPVKLRYAEPLPDRSAALKAESAFKRLDRGAKEKRVAAGVDGVFLVPRLEGIGVGAGWGDPVWEGAGERGVEFFRPESGGNRPPTRLRLAWDEYFLHGLFRVEDRDVSCACTEENSPVYTDSCVELFLARRDAPDYFNFEWNACGVMLAGHVTDPARNPDRSLRGFSFMPQEGREGMRVRSSLPRPPLTLGGPAAWTLGFALPLALLGVEGKRGTHLRGNFFKCGDRTPSPHWGSWRELTATNFHQPENFGHLILGG